MRVQIALDAVYGHVWQLSSANIKYLADTMKCWLSQRCVQMPIDGFRSADGTHTGDMHNENSQRPFMQARHKCILMSIILCLALAGIVYVAAV